MIELVTPRMKETSTADKVMVRRWGREVIKRYRGGIIRRFLRHVAAFFAHFFHREFGDERSKLPIDERRELESWESFGVLIRLTRRFNRDAAALASSTDGPSRVTRSIDYLFTDAEGGTVGGVDAKTHATNLAPLWCRLYAIADTLAQKRQSQFKWDWKYLFAFAFVALVFFTLSTHGEGMIKPETALVGYSAACLAIFVLFGRAKRGQHQERYLDYRALAEALRVAVYWKLVGIGSGYVDAKAGADEETAADLDPVGPIANAYPIKQPSELAWVKICLRTLERLDKAAGGSAHKIDPVGHAIARQYWVKGQYDYFRKQGLRHDSFAEAVEAHSLVLLLLSPFVVVPTLLYLKYRGIDFHWHSFHLQHAIIIIVGLLPGVAAVWTGYSERLAFKAQARQYDRMRMLFERAFELLPSDIDDESKVLARALYRELGMEAMRENAEWVAIYRQRPIQPLQ